MGPHELKKDSEQVISSFGHIPITKTQVFQKKQPITGTHLGVSKNGGTYLNHPISYDFFFNEKKHGLGSRVRLFSETSLVAAQLRSFFFGGSTSITSKLQAVEQPPPSQRSAWRDSTGISTRSHDWWS